MKVKVAKWGNSVAVRLPKAAVEALGVKPGETMELTVEKGRGELVAASRVRRPTLADLVAEMKRLGLGPEDAPPFEDWGILPSEWPDEDWSDIAPQDDLPGPAAPQKSSGRAR
jgi:antitoxin MazE